MRLSYTRTGNPDAPAVVFLHGLAMGQWMWSDQIDHFSDYDCYNVDLPGHAGSSHIAWESFDQAADCVAQLIAEVISDKPVYLVGMSLGAVVGLHLVARQPERIQRAVLTGAFAEAPPRLQIMLQGLLIGAILPTGWGKRLFARVLHIPPEAMPAYLQSIGDLSIPAYKRIIQQIATYAPPAGRSSIRVPVLFVTGAADIPFNRNAVKILAQQVNGSVGVYAPEVHHGWNGEAPELFNAMTRAWFEDQPLPPSLVPALP